MNNIFDYFAAHSGWLKPFVPLLCFLAWLAIESRWDAYVRRNNYKELKLLNDLREKSIITQKEFDEKKEDLLSA
jgi:hypothetical protein